MSPLFLWTLVAGVITSSSVNADTVAVCPQYKAEVLAARTDERDTSESAHRLLTLAQDLSTCSNRHLQKHDKARAALALAKAGIADAIAARELLHISDRTDAKTSLKRAYGEIMRARSFTNYSADPTTYTNVGNAVQVYYQIEAEFHKAVQGE